MPFAVVLATRLGLLIFFTLHHTNVLFLKYKYSSIFLIRNYIEIFFTENFVVEVLTVYFPDINHRLLNL